MFTPDSQVGYVFPLPLLLDLAHLPPARMIRPDQSHPLFVPPRFLQCGIKFISTRVRVNRWRRPAGGDA